MRFLKNVLISGTILCKSGLHLGGLSEGMEIGGIDNIVIRDPKNNLPFIPGSSLKGKMRSLIEMSDPEISAMVLENGGKPCGCGECRVCKIFGSSAEAGKEKGPTRLIIRDVFPKEDTILKWNDMEPVVRGAEVKYENVLNRITSEANPRPMERVPRGSEFEFKMVLSLYGEDEGENLATLLEGMKLLEDNYLGGSGTRGYGAIEFNDISISVRTIDYYKGTETEKQIKLKETLDNLLANISEIKQL